MSPARIQWLGRLPYGWALRLQRSRRRAVIDGRAPEVLWLLEHDPVITRGRRGGELLAAPRGVLVHDVERGGLATVHVPGQLVGYLILDLATRGIGVRQAVDRVEAGLIAWLAERGVEAHRRPGAPGVWSGDAKLAALGLHVSRGVTLHGFALNLDPDLTSFDWVVPCGLQGTSVASVATCGGGQLVAHEVADAVGKAVWAAVVDTPNG